MEATLELAIRIPVDMSKMGMPWDQRAYAEVADDHFIATGERLPAWEEIAPLAVKALTLSSPQVAALLDRERRAVEPIAP